MITGSAQVLFRLTWRLPNQPERSVLGTWAAVSALQALLVDAEALSVSVEALASTEPFGQGERS